MKRVDGVNYLPILQQVKEKIERFYEGLFMDVEKGRYKNLSELNIGMPRDYFSSCNRFQLFIKAHASIKEFLQRELSMHQVFYSQYYDQY